MTSTPLPDDDRLAFINDEYEVVQDDPRSIPPDADEADVIDQRWELPDDDDPVA